MNQGRPFPQDIIYTHSCLVPINEVNLLMTAILVWHITIYSWTFQEFFPKQYKINNTVRTILMDMSTLLHVRIMSLHLDNAILFSIDY